MGPRKKTNVETALSRKRQKEPSTPVEPKSKRSKRVTADQPDEVKPVKNNQNESITGNSNKKTTQSNDAKPGTARSMRKQLIKEDDTNNAKTANTRAARGKNTAKGKKKVTQPACSVVTEQGKNQAPASPASKLSAKKNKKPSLKTSEADGGDDGVSSYFAQTKPEEAEVSEEAKGEMSDDSDFEEVPTKCASFIEVKSPDDSSSASNAKISKGKNTKPKRKNVNQVKQEKKSPAKLVKSPMKTADCKDVSPMDLLLKLESSSVPIPDQANDSDSDSDWENVADINLSLKDQVPEKPVEITLEAPQLFNKKRKKKGFDMQEWFQRQVNRYQRETQLNMHKAHLLCLLAHGMQRNLLCGSTYLCAMALSRVPPGELHRPPGAWDLTYLSRLCKWFSKHYSIDAATKENTANMEETLSTRLETGKLASEEESVCLFVVLVRSLGGNIRFVMSLQPMSHKPNLKKCKLRKRRAPGSQDEDAAEAGQDAAGTGRSDETPSTSEGKTKPKPSNSKQDKSQKAKTLKKSKTPGTKSQTKGVDKSKSKKRQDVDTEKSNPRQPSRRKRSSNVNYKDNDSEAENDEDDDFKPSLSEASSDDEPRPAKLSKTKKTKTKPAKKQEGLIELSSGPDSDFEEMSTSFRSPTSNKPKNKKIVSSDSDDSVEIVKEKIKAKGSDYWAEVFLEKEGKWVCVDCIRNEINKPHEIEGRATKPVSYILAYDNDNCVKDVTRRYASSFSSTRKQRPDEEWWEETLQLYAPLSALRDSEEEQLQAELLKKPLPTSITEYKNHPLYALRRHLLKFEAIYPESAVPVGYVRGEPVYARSCVQLLHTRENWLKEARVVRIGETPYKLVKGRKKKRQAMEGGDVEPVAELFGRWQTEDYIPPPAVDGKVPKNEYGNIELFQPSMLPAGTVHLKGLNGLNRIARKLDIDVAAAMVGWEHHCGFAHPILDGWVVCEEHKDILLAAWDEEQEIIQAREAEKREKRIMGNWKLLVKGLLIRERLKNRFNLQPADTSSDGPSTSESQSGSAGQKASDMEMSWPQNRQKPSKKSNKKTAALFPFEEI